MLKQYEVLPCPFCGKGMIQCIFFPESYTVKKVHSGKGKATIARKSSSQWIIQSGCEFCGQGVEEVEKELRRKEII